MAATGAAAGKHALLVGLDPGVAERARNALAPTGLEIGEAADGVEALALAPRGAVNGLVAANPFPGGPVVRFVDAVRALASPLRTSGLVLVAEDGHRREAESLLGRGVNRVVAVDEVEARLPSALQEVMRTSPRVRVALPVRVGVAGARTQRRVFGRTANLSMSGMLLRMPHRLPVGTEVEFALYCAGLGGPVCGSARVVRHAVEGREPFPGAGLAFTGFEGGDDGRLGARLGQLRR